MDEITLVEPETLDEDMRLALSIPASGWTGLGFRPAFHFTVPLQGTGMRSAAAVFLSGDEMHRRAGGLRGEDCRAW